MKTFLFDRTSYLILVGSVVLILVGYFLMQGGGSDDPAVYNPEMFNFQRLVVAIIEKFFFQFKDPLKMNKNLYEYVENQYELI